MKKLIRRPDFPEKISNLLDTDPDFSFRVIGVGIEFGLQAI